MPPVFLGLELPRSGGRQRLRLWIPLVALWPLGIVAFALLLVPAAVAEAVLSEKGIRPLSILVTLLQLMTALSGLRIEVKSHGSNGLHPIHLFIQ
jgi:hypothetical protein